MATVALLFLHAGKLFDQIYYNFLIYGQHKIKRVAFQSYSPIKMNFRSKFKFKLQKNENCNLFKVLYNFISCMYVSEINIVVFKQQS